MSSTADRGSRRPRLTPAMADARRAVRGCLQRHTSSVSSGAAFLVAVSGGADSLALAWAAAFELPRHGYRASAVIVDHQLQEGSDGIAETAKTTVQEFGLETEVVRVSVAGTGGVENAAREARYEALEGYASKQGAEGVMLAHTLDDQAETVLMGLTRGSGPHSLLGMAEVNGMWWRPFLRLRRQTTVRALKDIGVSWWDDPHNTNPAFLRPRIRSEVVPFLEEAVGPGVTQALARTAELMREDADYLDHQATAAIPNVMVGSTLNAERLHELPRVIASRVVRRVIANATGEALSHSHTEQVMALLIAWKGQGPVNVPGGTVERSGSRLIVTPIQGCRD